MRGKVIDRTTGEPLIGAGVTITFLDSKGGVTGATTNINGEYMVLFKEEDARRRFEAKAGYIGYYSLITEDSVIGDRHQVITFPLQACSEITYPEWP